MLKWILAALVIWAAWHLLRPARPRPRTTSGIRTEADARAVLGVAPDAGEDAIRVAHRRLAAEAHPDRGGDADRAARINAARDYLLRRGSRR